MASPRRARRAYGGHSNRDRDHRSSRTRPENREPPDEMDAADFVDSTYARLPAGHKYHAKKVTVFGVDFPSKAEGRRYIDLTLMKEGGLITSEIELQVPFEIKILGHDGKERLLFKYVCDFRYTTKGGEVVVEDVKGAHTQTYLIKRKAMLIQHGIEIHEVYMDQITQYDI